MKKLYKFLACAMLALAPKLQAEGTKEMSPNAANITALRFFSATALGSTFNAVDDKRIKFYINDFNTESFYMGALIHKNTSGNLDPMATSLLDPDMYYRIKNAAGTVVKAAQRFTNTVGDTGLIDTYTKAVNGPNIGSVSNGYKPFVFTPTANGEYYVEIYRSTDNGVTENATNHNISFFDFTVANKTTGTLKPGRVYCDQWSLAASRNSVSGSEWYNYLAITSYSEPVLFAYTDDRCVVKIDFESGFAPIVYQLNVNSYGVKPTSPTEPWAITRKSVSANNAMPNGFKVFLNTPDTAIFPTAPIPTAPKLLNPVMTNCAAPYNINYNISEAGDVKILLNLNGVAGYQAGTSDRYIEDFSKLAGDNITAWDGKDGLGVAVAPGSTLEVTVNYSKGRFNVPIYDAELNPNGLKITAVAPIMNNNLLTYWDDTALTIVAGSNTSPAGVDNSVLGQLPPKRAWNGDGNPTFAVPAPASTRGNSTLGTLTDDYGNDRTLNTWGWAITVNSNNATVVTNCTDLVVTKTLNSGTVAVGNDIVFKIVAQNNGPTVPTTAKVNDLLPKGYTYVSDDAAGAYNPSTGVWNLGAIGLGAANAKTILITATIKATPALYNNIATVDSELLEANATNNKSNVTPAPLQNACYKPGLLDDSVTEETKLGITDLARAGEINNNWPMLRKSADLVLESKDKAFVINRLTDAELSSIPAANLVVGMAVYNITQDCLQINVDGTATGWKCFKTHTCID
jgi:uncharacterized repeat protein (TIGR01451 family)